MATNTLNYKLKKPAQTDFYNVEDQNENMEIIDSELKKVNDNVADLGETVVTHLADKTKHITPEEREKWNNPATTAENIEITDVGNYFLSTNTEGALQEIGQVINGINGELIAAVNKLAKM